MKIKGNVALVVLSIIAGLLVIISFVLFLKKDEVVKLPITVVEYADFQCPACGYYYPMVKKAIAKYQGTDNVTYEFKHYPLKNIHPYAYNAALASEAARLQNKFNEYSDLLFSKNLAVNKGESKEEDFLTDNKLVQYAVDLGMNRDKFVKDMQSSEVKAKVDKDITDGDNFGIQGTPTFIINGRQFRIQQINGDLNEQQLEDAVTKQFTDYIDNLLQIASKQQK